MTEWLVSLSLGPVFGTLVLLFVICGVVGIVAALTAPLSARSRTRVAEAEARTAEAKTRRAELLAELQPPYPRPADAVRADGHPVTLDK